MKKILVPTDLTILGDYAYTIANKVAQESNAEIIILSVVLAPQNALFDEGGDIIEDGETDLTALRKKEADLNLKLKEWSKGKTNLSKVITSIGNINQAIISCSKKENIDLIVMGTNGAHSHALFAHHSHSEFLINHTDIPVITLKCDRSNLNLDTIVLVSDFLEPTAYSLDILKSIQTIFKSKLVLLKILTKNQVRTLSEIEKTILDFALINKLENYEIQLYKDTNVESGVSKFCAEKSIDLIALGTHQRSGFSKFFRHSITDDLVNNLFHPILTFPIKD